MSQAWPRLYLIICPEGGRAKILQRPSNLSAASLEPALVLTGHSALGGLPINSATAS